ncbi:MAG: hypothetical protein VKO21_04385 [Candidatus Sericytochromatia bacterium]|nr:hypothetical protein [Candidatus Sericytochromatia bacterium]
MAALRPIVRILSASLVAGCEAGATLAGLGQPTLVGSISGSSVTGLMVGVLQDIPFPEDLPKAAVVPVAADGSFRYAIPAGASSLTAFAFRDANGNGRYDAGEPNSYAGCTACSYLQVVRVGDSWTVQAVGSGSTVAQGLASAKMTFTG